jgi:hypothetical protein
MKKKIFTPVTFAFFSGTVVGITLFALIAFTMGSPVPSPPVKSPLTVTEARAYLVNYLKTATKSDQIIKGVAIDKVQLDKMNRLLRDNANLVGFRIFLGLDDHANQVGIIVGINSTGADAVTTDSIYCTSRTYVGPCPPTCDRNSPISHD